MQKYYKHVEVKRLFHIAENTVISWVRRALKGENKLQLIEHGGRHYIASTAENHRIMEELAREGKKYLNSNYRKTVKPSAKFYELYTPRQVFDIVTSLDIHRELPLQYSYFDAGAVHWDEYINVSLSTDEPSNIMSTVKLLEVNQDALNKLLEPYKKVNIIDLGIGNAAPVRHLLQCLLEKEKLNRYIGIDISADMLAVAGRNLQDWFGDKVKLEGHVRDINYQGFDDLLIEDSFRGDNAPINLIVFFGGTLANFRKPDDTLRLINRNMGKHDLLLYEGKLDTQNTRRDFLNIGTAKSSNPNDSLNEQLSLLIKLLGIDEAWYQAEKGFDPENNMRYARIKPTFDLEVEFKHNGGYKIITLNKGEPVLIWRANHWVASDILNQFYQNSFNLRQVSLTPNQEYLFLIAGVEPGK